VRVHVVGEFKVHLLYYNARNVKLQDTNLMFAKILSNSTKCVRFKQVGSRLGRLSFKCDGTRAETTFRLSAEWTGPFKSAGASVQSTTGSRGVRISGSNVGYTMFLGSAKSTGYPLHSSVSPSLHLPYVTVCHHISTGLY